MSLSKDKVVSWKIVSLKRFKILCPFNIPLSVSGSQHSFSLWSLNTLGGDARYIHISDFAALVYMDKKFELHALLCCNIVLCLNNAMLPTLGVLQYMWLNM